MGQQTKEDLADWVRRFLEGYAYPPPKEGTEVYAVVPCSSGRLPEENGEYRVVADGWTENANAIFENGQWIDRTWNPQTSDYDEQNITPYVTAWLEKKTVSLPDLSVKEAEGNTIVFNKADWNNFKLRLGNRSYQGLINIEDLAEITGELEDKPVNKNVVEMDSKHKQIWNSCIHEAITKSKLSLRVTDEDHVNILVKLLEELKK